jgi:glycosyltransferase involved in cell wall biosynthesis
MTLVGRDIVCVGFADWDADLWTNQQHLMVRLARENRILFVESLGLRRPQLAGRDLRRIARRLVRGLRGPRERDGVHVLSPLVVPFHGSRLAREANRRILPALVRRHARRLGMRDVVLWSYVPQAEVLLDRLAPDLVIYHCDDDYTAQKGIDAESYLAAQARFARRADLVLASAPALAEQLRTHSERVIEAPNVADVDLFARALEPGPVDPAVAALPEPRIVFVGALVATKLDVALLAELARLRPDWSFALVGPVGPGDPRTDISALDGIPNLHRLGWRHQRDLPAVLRGAGAAIIPYAINPLTTSVFPMKVYEYLAAGLPVVATPLPSLAGVEGVAIEDSAAAFARRLEQELAGDGPERRRARRAVADGHSWEAQLERVRAAL